MANDFQLFILFIVCLLAAAWPLGLYISRIFDQEAPLTLPVIRSLESLLLRLAAIHGRTEMNWRQYAGAVIWFNLLGMALVFIIQLLQDILPFNPQQLPAVSPWHLAFNTAVSFMTNTNWQSYSGESTVSYFTQMVALTVQNFLSAATGLAVAIAFIRGLTRKNTSYIGNYWSDLLKSILYVLLPLSIVFSLLFVQQGVPQTLAPYTAVQTLEGSEQIIALGPVASQEAIKLLGVNGGGFFNANSAHPFENPTPFNNFLEIISIFLIPASLLFTFGSLAGDKRQGYALLTVMSLLFVVMLTICYTSELSGNPIVAAQHVSGPSGLEGKEVRFGIGGSSLFAAVTTAASCGAVNAMHDSFTPLGGMALMLQMMLGEVIFGGVGAGLYGMLVYVILTVFIVGLMVGRTPEYLGKKIEAWEMKMVTIAILIPAITILTGSAAAAVTEAGLAGLNNPGPHGLSEILYAFSSAAGNNGSAFAGLSANSLFYNLALAVSMLLGRFGILVPVLAMAGSLAQKNITPPSAGTFPTTGWLFVMLLTVIILIIGALTFLPALTLGPIIEHLLMQHHITL